MSSLFSFLFFFTSSLSKFLISHIDESDDDVSFCCFRMKEKSICFVQILLASSHHGLIIQTVVTFFLYARNEREMAKERKEHTTKQ